jgi:hypothetical protein
MRLSTSARTFPTRARAFVGRCFDFVPVTWLGLFVGALSYTAITRYATAQMDLVLLVVGWGVAALLALAVLLVAFSTVALVLIVRSERSDAPPTTETGVTLPTGRTIPTLAFVPLVTVGVTWEHPEGASCVLAEGVFRRAERGRFEARGDFASITRVLVVADVFGLSRLRIRVREQRVTRAIPHMGGLRSLPTLRSMSSGDAISHPLGLDEGDRADLRRYAPGDSARFIHWKIFARSRRLMVRVPERAISPSKRIVAYFVSGTSDEASAGAARAALELGAFGAEWVFAASGTPDGTNVVPAAVDAIVRSATHRDDAGRTMQRFLTEADRRGPSALVLFVPPVSGPWLANVARVLRERKSGARVVVGVDGIAAPRRSLFSRLLVAQDAEASRGVDPVELDAVVTALEATRAEVVVVDRGSGRVLRAPGARRALQATEVAA